MRKTQEAERLRKRASQDSAHCDILIVHPGAELYGSDRMMVETVRAFIDADRAVTVVLPQRGPLVPLLKQAGATVAVMDTLVFRKDLLKLRNVHRLVFGIISSMLAARSALREIRPGIVLCNTITQSYWLISARMLRMRTICHVREAETQINSLLNEFLLAPLVFSQLLIANSAATQQYLRQSRLLRSKESIVVYNGKDWSAYAGQHPSVASSPSVRLGVIGRISPRKGQDVAIDALALLRDRGFQVNLDFYGDVFTGYEWYRDQLDDQIQRHELGGSVRFCGFVDDVTTILPQLDIAIVPSRLEPFGTVAAESMASGRLTVVSNVQGLIEIVEDQVTGLVFESEDAQDLAAVIQRVLANPEDYHRVADAGRQSVRERFSTVRYSREMVSALCRLEPCNGS